MNCKRIIITGGSGFIGTNLIDFYEKQGCELLNIDIKPPQKSEQASYWSKIDIRDFNTLLHAFTSFKPDCILHMAARADLRGKTIEEYNTNTTGVKNIIKAANQTDSVRKVVFASTMLVCKVGYIPKHETDYCPPNLYGESKVIGENLVRNSSYNFDWVIVRPSSIWGPWFGPTYRSFFEMLIKRRYFNFAGKMSTKTYGFIGNVVYQINELLISEKTNGCTYYLGDYEPTAIKEWAKEISRELNYSVSTIPRWFIFILAFFGDMLAFANIRFPMNSFRLKNMTTDNILPLNNLKEIAPRTIYTRHEGNKLTLKWMFEYYINIESDKK